jgi:hypothetical protein
MVDMAKRFFITQHPTFGSYASPIKSKIEKSPYFYWFKALTLNDDYIEYCAHPTSNRFKTNDSIHQVFKDFGDVRYEGCVYLAFTRWWIQKLNETETRGTYLFAEPYTGTKVELVTDITEAKSAADDESVLLIRIPKIINRKRIDEAIDKILASEMQFERGRKVRNPSRSNARYHLSKPVKVESLKEAFEVYELERDAMINGTKISNLKLAKAVGIKVQQKKTEEQAEDYSYQSELINTKVWRRKKLAKEAIANVVNGRFV